MKSSSPVTNKNQSDTNAHKEAKEPIAIVGMSCRFPQANTLDAFWALLKNGKHTIEEIPADRWNIDDYYDADPNAVRKTYQRFASMLEKIHDFDPFFFNISPAEAVEMNPSQKLMLEVAWEAIENSNIPLKSILGSKAGVYIGNIWSDYQHLRKHKNAMPTSHSSMGQASDLISTRVSFNFGFTGPSMVLDTGCSSSLVALNFACQSLWDGTNQLALTGGINIVLDPDQYVILSQFGGLSVKGKCSSFDAEADGFVRGEGAGLLVLKKLSDAERDGNKIYAVIRGTAVNNNGFNVNLPATSVDGQMRVFADAYAQAGITPGQVHYVEAHGTGTKLGDPTEAKALGQFFQQGRENGKLLVGSVKTNLGHTEATAGIAGLIKVVLAMQHKMLPASLNFKTPNPEIPFEELKLKVNDTLGEWPALKGETLKAGVNSFGWGGTNAHAIIEEYVDTRKVEASTAKAARFCLPLSARSHQALKEYAVSYSNSLGSVNEENVQNFCAASSVLKPEFEYRTFISGNTKEDLIKNLEDFRQDETEIVATQPLQGKEKIVFVFPGQGSQWLGMGCELFNKEEVFRKTIEECDVAFRAYTDLSLIQELNASPETSRLKEINIIQPSLFAVQIALAKLWMSLGIVPHTVVGHSMGEVAAAHIAGVLSLDDAARIICTRSLLMKTVSGKGGAMAVTELTIAEAEKVIVRYPKLSIAVSNSPKSTVLAGDKDSIDQLLIELEGQGLFCKLVKVDVASHSQQMDPLKEELREALLSIKPQPATINIHSTVMGKRMAGEDMNADYWVANLRGTVQFSDAMQQLMGDSHSIFIETSPHPVLTNAVNECAEHFKTKVITVASVLREKPEQESFYKNLGELFGKGYSINWMKYYQLSNIPSLQLPAYPFQREHYELEDKSAEREGMHSGAAFPLLGNSIQLADTFNTQFWESHITLDKFAYLKNRVFNNSTTFSETAYIEMVLEAAYEIQEGCTPAIENMKFVSSAVLTDDQPLHLQLKISKVDSSNAVFQFYKKNNANDRKSSWTLAVEGDLCLFSKHMAVNAIPYIAQPEKIYTGEEFYQSMKSIGMSYGEYFSNIKELRQAGDTVTFKIVPDARFQQHAKKYRLHPALIETFFQPVFSTLLNDAKNSAARATSVISIKQIDYFGDPDYQELHGFVHFSQVEKNFEQDTVNIVADMFVFNSGTPVLQIKGLKVESKREAVVQGINQQKTLSFQETYMSLTTNDEKSKALEQLVIQHVAKIIKTSSAKIKPAMTFKGVGIDSLMAIQLRNLLEKDLFLKLSVSMFWAHPSIHEYTMYLKEVLSEYVVNDTNNSGGQIVTELLGKSNKSESHSNEKWFVIPKPNPTAAFKVFCFHDAGGNSNLFHDWENLVGDNVEMIAVELPGRGRRIGEKAYVSMSSLLHDLMPHMEMMLDRPFLFVGHSMGGLIAFEIVRELRKRNNPLPGKLFISSTAGLTSYAKEDVDYQLSDEALVAMYPHLAMEKIGDKELQQLLVGILRADLELIYNYSYYNAEPLDIPIVAVHGSDDKRVKLHQIKQWEKETMSSFTLINRQGGHRYIEHDAEFVTNLVMEEIVSATVSAITTKHISLVA